MPQIDQNTNRIQTGQNYQYDLDGNVVQEAGGKQFTFDGDNKQIEVKDAANNTIGRYYYDGNAKRVKKVTASETTVFVYDGTGKLVAEYSTAAPTTNPTTNYTATDSLGSPRVITNKQGEIVSRRDFMPFGEELYPDAVYRKSTDKYGAADSVRQKFTGYQRDEETGLDFAEARYYNNNHGRFTAVDPLLASGKSDDPQTFNRYAYTMNRPLILTDETGLQAATKPETKTLIPLPKVLLDRASLSSRTTVDGKVFKLSTTEVNERVKLATLAYNEGFEQGERDAQALLGQDVDVNSLESNNSSGNETSRENSTETGISASTKDVGVSAKQTDSVGEKDSSNAGVKVGAAVDSGTAKSVTGTQSVAKARQTVVNKQSAAVRSVTDANGKTSKGTIDVSASVDELVDQSKTLGKADGKLSYLKSKLDN